MPATASFTGTSPNYKLELGIPAGPVGPAPNITASAQSVSTEQGADVKVTGVNGTYNLEFSIPAGPKGDIPTITATAETTDPDSEAQVQVQETEGNYQLKFSIPQGPTGPINGLAAYGGIYNNLEQTIDIKTGGVPVNVILQTQMPNKNVKLTGENITVNEYGDYMITYSICLVADTAGIVKSYVRDDNIEITQSKITNDLTQKQLITYSNTIITTLSASEVIDLVLESNNQGYLTVKYANLTVLKLNTGEF